MTYAALPYDPWFDPNYKYIPYGDEGFHNPLDDMPIATNDRFDMYGSSDCDDAYNPRPEEDIAGWFKDETEPLDIPIEETLHEKMYQMATKNGGSWLGGSENCHGGSENVQTNR